MDDELPTCEVCGQQAKIMVAGTCSPECLKRKRTEAGTVHQEPPAWVEQLAKDLEGLAEGWAKAAKAAKPDEWDAAQVAFVEGKSVGLRQAVAELRERAKG